MVQTILDRSTALKFDFKQNRKGEDGMLKPKFRETRCYRCLKGIFHYFPNLKYLDTFVYFQWPSLKGLILTERLIRNLIRMTSIRTCLLPQLGLVIEMANVKTDNRPKNQKRQLIHRGMSQGDCLSRKTQVTLRRLPLQNKTSLNNFFLQQETKLFPFCFPQQENPLLNLFTLNFNK